ncbi:metallophosphoesterase family protein [Paenibacillus sp. MBLB4367]|uniref:metallophosphoesterase family protein n=1 Tax=Paenibacillus sp. MBLB4367 TaxID=3384767 RepID=UPI003907ECA6
MMIIGIVSDTHITGRARSLPDALVQGLRQVDAIIHAGDWVTMEVAEELSKFAPIHGVAGNGDGEELVRRFGRKTIVEFQGVRIGIVHGHEGPGKSTPERASRAFHDERTDLIVFGHSHIPFMERNGQTVLFNPGSPTDKRRQPDYSFGMLTIHDGKFSVNHHFFT